MEEAGNHPGPLRIVKNSLDASAQDIGGGKQKTPYGSSADPVRRTSVTTDESMGSIREEPGIRQRPLAIPKRRRPLPTWHDDGTGRFYSPSASHSATQMRRSQNATDNVGPGSESDDIGPHTDNFRELSREQNEHEIIDRFGSVRSQFLRDERRGSSTSSEAGSFHQQLPPQHGLNNRRLLDHDDAVDHFRRMSLRGDGSTDSYHTPFYDPLSERQIPMQSGQPESFSYTPESFRDLHRQASISNAGTDRFDPYSHVAASSHSIQPHTYGRPMPSGTHSMIPDIFPREPIERAATAIPYGNRYHHHSPFQDRQFEPPRAHTNGRLSSRLSQFGSMHESNATDANPQILVPIVSVTPECRTVEGDVNSFWVAIELFAQITQPLDTMSSRDNRLGRDFCQVSNSAFSPGEDRGLYRFGYISNLNIKILPSYQAKVLEVIGKSSSLLTLLPGSRRLMIVHIHLDTTEGKKRNDTQDYRPSSHKKRSDQLLEDLEFQLGATSQEYMQIQLTYSHSGFPKRDVGRDPMDRDGGCIEVRTTIETTVTALVMQQNSSSMWSPAPAPASSPLVDIVAKHWGPSAAKEMARRIATSAEMRMLRRSQAPLADWDIQLSEQKHHNQRLGTPKNSPPDASLDDITPRAESQLQKKDNDRQGESVSSKNISPSQERPIIPSRKVKKGTRPISATFLPHRRVSLPQIPRLALSSANVPMELEPTSPGCLLPRSKATKLGADGPRQPVPDTAPRNIRRPIGIETTNLQNFVPTTSDQNLKDENYDERLAAYAGYRSMSRNSTVSKRSGKWSWSGWFS